MAIYILTLVGPDRPGLVGRLSERVAEAGGSWLESRMARLEGQFAGIVSISLPGNAAEASHGLAGLHAALEETGLQAVLREARPEAAGAGQIVTLELVCLDRPGIIRDISAALAGLRVNIEELTTHIDSGSFSGEAMFRAEARLKLPAGLSVAQLRAALEVLGSELMVDLRLGGED